MLHQQEILQWLKTFSVNQIKHFLTIKNPKYLFYIERIMNSREDSKPNQRWIHGFSEQSIKDTTSIYQRDNFRYKKHKQKKKAADECFYQNITVSRGNPYSLSVRKQFIKNGKLSECMLIISDEQIFNCYTSEKYLHSQLGSYQHSAWFSKSNINSLSMWIIRMFELEIFDAFSAHQHIHSINHFVFAQECITREKVKNMLENCIRKHVEKFAHFEKSAKHDNNAQNALKDIIEISKQQGPYLLQKCLEKLDEAGRDIGQVIFEDIWCIYDNKNKVNRIYMELYDEFMEQYDEYLIDIKCQEIQSITTSTKKKKKKPKKHKQQPQAAEIKPEILNLQKQKSQKLNTLKQSKSSNQLQQKTEIEKNKKDQKSKEPQPQKQSKKLKQPVKNILEPIQQLNEKKMNEQRQKEEQKKFKKIINQRINENIQIFYEQLYESSQTFDKYRKLCFQIIKIALQQMKIQNQWRLELFGSASINFALKQSDLDLVLIIDNEKSCSLVDIYEHFKVKQWIRQCNIIMQARVPIVEFEVSLSQLKHPKFKDLKKIINSVIHVDISISYQSSPHEGLKNTQFLKQIFESHPNLMIVCLILKELLRINQLNKPYKGGIGSYVLVILTYNILKLKEVDLEDNLMNQLKSVANYMTTKFEPFITLITPFKNSKLKANSEISLNIEDPHERVLLHTSARLINEIISLFKQLHYTLDIIELQMGAASIEERKRMKKIFFQNWNSLFKKGEMGEERSS